MSGFFYALILPDELQAFTAKSLCNREQTEGLNSKIEVVKRSACGYRNKDNFRTAILFHCGKLDLMPTLEG